MNLELGGAGSCRFLQLPHGRSELNLPNYAACTGHPRPTYIDNEQFARRWTVVSTCTRGSELALGLRAKRWSFRRTIRSQSLQQNKSRQPNADGVHKAESKTGCSQRSSSNVPAMSKRWMTACIKKMISSKLLHSSSEQSVNAVLAAFS